MPGQFHGDAWRLTEAWSAFQSKSLKVQRNVPPFRVTARPRLEVGMLIRALKLQLTGQETLVGALKL
jgi:hypothetical protein